MSYANDTKTISELLEELSRTTRYYSSCANIQSVNKLRLAASMLKQFKAEAEAAFAPGYRFDEDDLRDPDDAYEIETWDFNADLNPFFGLLLCGNDHGNNTIGKILEDRGVLEGCTWDSEYSCLYVQCPTKEAGIAFITRLNDQPELKNFKQVL